MKRLLLLMIFVLVSSFVLATDFASFDDFESGCGSWTQDTKNGATISCSSGIVTMTADSGSRGARFSYDLGVSEDQYEYMALIKYTESSDKIYVTFGNKGDATIQNFAAYDLYGWLFTSDSNSLNLYDNDASQDSSTLALTTGWTCVLWGRNSSHAMWSQWANTSADSCTHDGTYDYVAADAAVTESDTKLSISLEAAGAGGNGKIEIEDVWRNTTTAESAPSLTAANCTSCNIPYGDSTEPYSTSDTTPTFSITTNDNANCRIGDTNENFTTMGSSRDCSTTGTSSHVCTLTVQDELVFSTDYVYIACENLNNKEGANATAMLTMQIDNLAQNSTNHIDIGIKNSVIWPGATIYSDQAIYIRDVYNQQISATVDRVAVYGNQRWILHVTDENETRPALFNISPVVYTLNLANVSLTEIENKVTALINSTKN